MSQAAGAKGQLSANDNIQRFAAPSRPLSPLPEHTLFNEKTRCFVYGLQPRAVQGMLDFDFICKRKTPSVAGIIYTFGGQFVSKMYWGTSETLLPVYQQVDKAVSKHPDVDVVVNFASSRSVYSSTLELMEYPQIKTIAIIAEGVPERRAREIAHIAKKKGITIIGPATVGGIKPGSFKIGNTGGMMDNIVASKLYRKGSVGYVSKSGGMSNELNNIISQNTDGVYEGVAIGGDRYPGTTFIDHLLRYQADPDCKILVLLGEVGGVEEYKVIDAVKQGIITKPIVAWAIGTCASMFKTEVQFGHAGAFANSQLETAATKNQSMRDAGFHVPKTFEDMPALLKEERTCFARLRSVKKRRRYERLAATSQLSLHQQHTFVPSIIFIMLFLILIQFVLCGVYALPASQNSLSCAHDDLYTSLSKDGREFCSSMVKTHCEGLSTPTQFTSYPATQLSLYCECVLTSCTGGATSSPTASRTETGQHATSSSSDGSSTSLPTTSAHITKSSGHTDRNGSGEPTTTNIESGGSSSNTDEGSATTKTSSGTSTDRTTVSSNSPESTEISGSDTGSVTGKVTPTSRGSFKETTTSGWSDSTSDRGTSTGSGVVTSSTQRIDATLTTSTQSSNSTSEDPSSTASTSGGGSTSPTGDSRETSTNDPTQSSHDGSISQTSQTSDVRSWTSGLAPSGLNTKSKSITDPVSSVPRNTDSTTQTFTSGNISTSAGWNLSTTVSSWATGTRGSATVTSLSLTSSLWSLSSSMGATGSPGTWNVTTVTTPTSPPFLTPSGFNTSTISRIANATQTSPPTLPAANFTQVTRTGAISKPTCYQMPQPQGGSTRRALLHNTNIREQNATIPFPYIESVDFETDGIDPLYFTVRDAAQGSHNIDISNTSYIAIVDSLHNAMILDAEGIHFSTKDCKYDVSITIDSMYQQLAKLSGQVCAAGDRRKRMNDMDFTQPLYLRDQCNNPIKRTVRKYPDLKVGNTDCNDIEADESTGRWLFDCTFPGADSGTMRCQWKVRNDIEKFLFTEPFGGACPDLSTVITTLEANGQDFINPESLRTELYNQGLDETQKAEADLTVIYYEQLWEILKQAFSKLRTQPAGRISAIEEYIGVYNQYRNFRDDICEDLHAGDMPLKMSLRAGVTHINAIATLNWAPVNPKPFNVTIQDPSKMACCPYGSVAKTDDATGICAYPFSARIGNTGCICGKTSSGGSVAFKITECDNFVSECEVDGDCASAGHPSYVCVTGSCCGHGVCVDPYECAQNGTMLVNTRLF